MQRVLWAWLCFRVLLLSVVVVWAIATTGIMVQGYQVQRVFHRPSRYVSKTLTPVLNHVRFASSSFALDLFEVNQVIALPDGRHGKIVEKGRNGWMSVSVENEEKVVKVRSNEVKSIVGPSEPLVLLEEVESKEAEFLPLDSLPIIEPPPLHKVCKQWVIFSDLHVKGSSIETCEEVLHKVHEEAKQRNGGVIFLGDFWHVRGALSVELLNRVLKALRKWTQPVIMIPGNHDQVSLGGTVHALEPLVYAFRPDQILMIDEPSICMNALWIPYRRDRNVMKQILDFSWKSSDISVIFCHADVCGAWMNDNIQSRDGLDVMMFPPSIPIYSGHFHKPHTLIKQAHSLRYVGSPYQTSLSEADQVKYLYCMEVKDDAARSEQKTWKEAQRWPISVGKKYLKVQDLSDQRLQQVTAGDRVVMTIPIQHFTAADSIALQLRQRGVEVEIRPERIVFQKHQLAEDNDGNSGNAGEVTALPPIETVVELDPVNVFKQFIEDVNISTIKSALSTDMATTAEALQRWKERILQEGLQILDQLMGNNRTADNHRINQETNSNIHNQHLREIRDIALDGITLKDFGPYGGKKVSYPLSKRGLVLIRGKSTDGTGADSNGSGKTTLAMSILWALTGSMDTRLIGDTRSFDVSYDAPMLGNNGNSKRFAEVKLMGQINQKPFEIIRRKNAKKHELLFQLDGQDLTTQSVKDTQLVIENVLGIGNGLLQRCYFFGQHSHTSQSLLGLTDAKLKEEFQPLMNSDIWILASSEVRQAERKVKSQSQERELQLKWKDNEQRKFQTQLEALDKEVQRYREEMLKLEQSRPAQHQALIAQLEQAEHALQSLDHTRQQWYQDHVQRIRQELSAMLQQQQGQLHTSSNTASSRRSAPTQQHLNTSTLPTTSSSQQSVHELEGLRTSFHQLSASLRSLENLVQDLERKLAFDRQQSQQVQSQINSQVTTWMEEELHYAQQMAQSVLDVMSLEPVLIDTKLLSSSLPQFQLQLEEAALLMRALDEQIKMTNSTLFPLQQSMGSNISTTALPTVATTSEENIDATHCMHNAPSSDEMNCPTCGQHLPMHSSVIVSKVQELEQILSNLLQQRRDADNSVHAYKRLLAIAQQVLQSHQGMEGMHRTMAERQDEQAQHRQQMQATQSQLQAVEAQLQHAEDQLATQQASFQAQIQTIQERLQAAETQYHQYNQQYETHKQQLNALKSSVESQRQEEMRFNQTYYQCNTKLTLQQTLLQEKTQALEQSQQESHSIEQEKQALSDRQLVLEQLVLLFGSKGIQHYLFQSAISQLEVLANNYLLTLSDGGIRLQLKSDVEQEKVLKTVLMRSVADGQWRERGLAQLSGGQWRRVSLALDLAFTELVRRRGILRFNVMIMDEILTHLDAAGRESVGSVLKALVENDAVSSGARSVEEDIDVRESEEERRVLSNALTDTCYETILVILQDLVATELEESFDHIDVVVKDGDASRVILDGGIDA